MMIDKKHNAPPRSEEADETLADDGKRASKMGDIAAAAGVSISTVSRALRGSSGVSVALRQKIAALAADMEYEGRSAALSGRPMQVYTVISMDLFAGDPAGFYREIVEAIDVELDSEGVPVTVIFLEQGADNVARIRELCDTPQPVGLLLMGLDDPELLRVASESAEVVLVNGSDPGMTHDGVTPANKRGAYMATRYLLGKGHKRIAHFTCLQRLTIRARLEGYKLALGDHGGGYDEKLVFDLPALAPEDAAVATREALAAGKLDDVTAIFCASDMVGVGVISSLVEGGKTVPGDYSVAGFDNTRVTQRHRPGLTTVAVDLVEVGRQSARRLIARMRQPELPALDIRVGCRLVERESTRAIDGGA